MYEVTWLMDVEEDEVDSHRAAAEYCRTIMQDPSSICTCFTVKKTSTNETKEIDLEYPDDSIS